MAAPSPPPSKGWKADEDLQDKIVEHRAQKKNVGTILLLAWGSLGVVYGDIGTSPLYVYESIFSDNEITKSDVAGAISLIFWTLTLIALIKYTLIVPFANDDGEGGTFALYTLLCRHIGIAPHGPIYATDRRAMLQLTSVRRFVDTQKPWWKRFAINGSAVRRWIRAHVSSQRVLFVTTLIATALILGDGVLTPAQSVLSAMGGMQVAKSTISQDAVVGSSIAILVALFAVQFLGTHRVTAAFSPVVALWLLCNAIIGVYNMAKYDGAAAWAAIDPGEAIHFLTRTGNAGWRMLGAVMLAVTGSETMFLDMGHFSHAGIAIGFGLYAYPCLVLTYIGQGAWLMDRLNAKQLYYKSVPHSVFYPMLVLAMLASIVASQALISGSFSIIRQAINMGAFPRLKVKNTGKTVEGQIYIGPVNWVLMILCVAVVAGFQSTVALGNAYGTAVMAVFVITSILIILVMITVWEMSFFLVALFGLVYLSIEGVFLSSTLTKIPQGAWFTIAMAGGVTVLEIIWWVGCLKKHACLAKDYGNSLEDMLLIKAGPGANGSIANVKGTHGAPGPVSDATAADGTPDGTAPPAHKPNARRLQLAFCRPGGEPMNLARLRGIGIYYAESPVGVPPVLVHFLKNVQALHEVSIFLTVRTLPVPYIERHDRLLVRALPSMPHFYQVVARYGYMDEVDHSVKFMTHLVEAIADHMRSMADMQAVQAATALAADIAADSVRLGGRPTAGDLDTPPRLESVVVQAQSREITIATAVDALQIIPASIKGSTTVPAVLEHGTVEAKATAAVQPARGVREPVDGVVAVSLTVSSAASSRTQSSKDMASHILDVMAHQGVVYYVGRTIVRAPRVVNIFNEMAYGAAYRVMDALTQSDVYEQWSIPLEQLIELGLSVHV